jgi:hypothetical protein
MGKQNFKAVDLIIPMAFANKNGDIGLQSMSYIVTDKAQGYRI